MWMKSKLQGAKVQSSSASSSSNLQFGGTNKGMVFDISVPITSADGNWSAKSLFSINYHMVRGKRLRTLPRYQYQYRHLELSLVWLATCLIIGVRQQERGNQKGSFTCAAGPIGAKNSWPSSNNVSMWCLSSYQQPSRYHAAHSHKIELITLCVIIWGPGYRSTRERSRYPVGLSFITSILSP